MEQQSFHRDTQWAHKMTSMPSSQNLILKCIRLSHRIMKSTVIPLLSLEIPAPESQDWSRAPSTSSKFEPEHQQAADASVRMWRFRLGKQVCVCLCAVWWSMRNRETEKGRTVSLNCCLKPCACPRPEDPLSSCMLFNAVEIVQWDSLFC